MYSVKNKKTNKKSRKRKLLLAAAILLVVAGVAFALVRSNKNNNSTTSDTGINYSPPTKTDKEETEANKDKIVEDAKDKAVSESKKEDTTQSGTKSVKPTITYADSSRVNAYVSGIFEEGGTCKATFTKGGTTLTKTSTGFENVSYTQCAPFNLETGFLSSGDWSLIVSYNSAAAAGVSDVKAIKVN